MYTVHLHCVYQITLENSSKAASEEAGHITMICVYLVDEERMEKSCEEKVIIVSSGSKWQLEKTKVERKRKRHRYLSLHVKCGSTKRLFGSIARTTTWHIKRF